MTKRELMIKAHQMTKEIKAEYKEVDYKFQLGLCMSYLLTEGVNEMIEYTTKTGTRVCIKLNGENISDLNVNGVELLRDNKKAGSAYITTLDNTIVINSSYLYKKLGSVRQIRIEANEELMKAYKEEFKKYSEEERKIYDKAFKNSSDVDPDALYKYLNNKDKSTF